MPVYTWPAELPQRVLVAGYQEQFRGGSVRSQPTRGPAIVRPKTSANIKPFKASVVLHAYQVDILEDFHLVTLDKGTWSFIMPHPRKNNQPLLDAENNPILNPDGTVILVAATALMRFVDPPIVVAISPVTWSASMSLEQLP